MKKEKEIRVLNTATTNLTVEMRGEDGAAKITGYAAVFNSDSEDIGFIERIKPGAFKKALKKSDVRALFNHDPNYIIGRSGVNLHLAEDKTGLKMTVDPIPTETYRMVAENINAGLVTQQSFAFTVADDEWNEDYTQRTIKEVDEIFDVSPVTYPAYPDTTVALRARDKYKRGDDRRGPKIAPGKPSGAPKSADKELWTRYDNLKKEM
jgi:HK97 family phage prohead protease